MKGLQKRSKGSKLNQSVQLCSIEDSEPVEMHNFQDQNHENEIFFGTSIRNYHSLGSQVHNSEKPWTFDDENKLIELHKQCGNKWTLIAQHYPGMCENSIKNRFYSRLRKSVRKLNKVIGIVQFKKYNKFKLNIIFKLSNISQGKMAEKQKIVPQIFHFYRVALENLFRLVRGQRVAKGKKKNIAYLRQFSFKLSLQNDAQMVISKENIFLINRNQNQLLESTPGHYFQEKRGLPFNEKTELLSETSTFHHLGFANPEFSPRKESLDLKHTYSSIQSSMELFKAGEEADCKTQSSMWKDYLGQEMKEYDICGQDEISFEQEINFGLYSLKNPSLIGESSIW